MPENEQGRILYECHASPYRGHFTGDKTTHKILQLGFFIGLPFLKIVLNGLNFVINARDWVTFAKSMKCPCKVSWWCNYLMCGE